MRVFTESTVYYSIPGPVWKPNSTPAFNFFPLAFPILLK